MAWLGTLLLSRFPQVIAQEFFNVDLGGRRLLWWWLAVGVTLLALASIWQRILSLRGYFGVLTTIYALTLALNEVVETDAWQSCFGGAGSPWVMRFFGERLVVVLIALGVAGVLMFTGESRQGLFLAHGDWRAPTGLRLPGRTSPISWIMLGPTAAIGLTTLIGAGAIAMSPVDSLDWGYFVRMSPFILFFALMNAFGEELAYRAAPLSQLCRVTGESQAVWLTAVWFGLGHYYGGVPSGPVGAVSLTFIAVLFGRAMLETRGITMPVFIHLFGDIVVYGMMALGEKVAH